MAIFCPTKVKKKICGPYIWVKSQGQNIPNAESCPTHSAIFHKQLRTSRLILNVVDVMAIT